MEKEDIFLDSEDEKNGFCKVFRRNETPTPEKDEGVQAHSHEAAIRETASKIIKMPGLNSYNKLRSEIMQIIPAERVEKARMEKKQEESDYLHWKMFKTTSKGPLAEQRKFEQGDRDRSKGAFLKWKESQVSGFPPSYKR